MNLGYLKRIIVIALFIFGLLIGNCLVVCAGQLKFDGVPVDITTATGDDLILAPGAGGNTQIGIGTGTNTYAITQNDLHITGILETSGAAYFDSNVILGDSTSDDVTVSGYLVSDIIPKVSASYNLGSSSLAWQYLYVNSIAGYNSNLLLSPALGFSLTGSVKKSASTGNETAYDLSAVIDKATSGNYTGIKLNVTETSAPGTADKLLDLQVGGASLFQIYNGVNSANYGLLSIGSGYWDGATSGYFSGSTSGTLLAGNTASEFTGNLLDLQIAGVSKFKIDSTGNIIVGGTAGGGTANYIPKWNTSSTLTPSAIYESSGKIGIGTTAPIGKLQVAGGQILVDDGTFSAPAYSFANEATSGIYRAGEGNFAFSIQGTARLGITPDGVKAAGFGIQNVTESLAGGYAANGTGVFAWQGTYPAMDTGLSRGSAAKVYVGNGTQGDYSGTLIASNVGIGTTAPTALLHVGGPSAFGGGYYEAARFNASGGANGDGSYISFGSDMYPTWRRGTIGAKYDSTTSWGSDLFLQVNSGSAATSLSDAMVIKYNGNVGIGTTAPTAKLVVRGTDASNLIRLVTDSPSTGGTSYLEFTGSGDDQLPVARIGAYTQGGWGGDILFQTTSNTDSAGYTTKMIIQRAGNVGIGTAAPAAKLEVSDSTDIGVVLQISTPGLEGYQQAVLNLATLSDANVVGSASNRGWHIAARGNAYETSAQQNDLGFYYWDGSVYNSRLYLDNAGNVGIGTTAPVSKLAIQVAPTASANYGLVSLGSGAWDGSTAGYFGTGASSNASGTVLAVNTASGYAGDLANLEVAGASKFKVDASGNVTTAGTIAGSGTLDGSGVTNYLSKWSDSNTLTSSVIYDDGTNVGIGTASPGYLLEISATNPIATITSGAGKTSTLRFADGTITWDLGHNFFNTADGNFYINSAGGDNILLCPGGVGSVGVGTSDVSAALEVVSATEQLRLGYSDDKYFSTTVGATGATTLTPFAGTNLNVTLSTTGNFAVNTNQFVVDTSEAKIGIGTTTPTNILSLGSGSAQKFWIENTATDTAGKALTVAAGGTIEGTVVPDVAGGNLILQSGLGTGAGESTISFQTGTTLATNTTLQTMSTKMTILGSGNVGIGTTAPVSKLAIQVAPTASANYGLVSLGSGAWDGSTAGYFGTGASSNASGTVLAVNTASGYAGDLANLEVAGASKFKVDASGNVTTAGTIAGSGTLDGSGVTNYLSKWSDSNTFTSSVIYDNGTNVGIGTATPNASYKMEIKDVINNAGRVLILTGTGDETSTGGTGPVLTLQNINTTTGNFTGLSFGGAISSIGGIYGKITDHTNSYGDLYFTTRSADGWSDKMAILSTGNVGIGTLSPQTKLEINNSAYAGELLRLSGAEPSVYNLRIRNYNPDGLTVGYAFDTYDYGAGGTHTNILTLVGGKVGIGLTDPAAKLHIQDDVLNGAISTSLKISQNGTGAGTGAGIWLGAGTGLNTQTSQIAGFYDGTGNVLTFGTGIWGDVHSEKVRIDSSGNVGIGTANPISLLNIAVAPTASANYGLVSLGSGAWDGSTAGYFGTGSSSNASGTVLAVNAASGYAGDLANLEVAGASKFKVDASGNVTTAGTISGSGTLDGSGVTNYLSKWSDSNTLASSVIYDDGTNVGIGTAAPNEKLEASGASAAIRLTDTDTAGVGRFRFYENTTNIGDFQFVGSTHAATGERNWMEFVNRTATGGVSFWTNSTQQMSINSSGNVGIGTTAPGTKLDINLASTATLTDIQQIVASNALALTSAYGSNDNYHAGLIWSTTDDNPTKPKSGIWSQYTASGSKLQFGTTNSYATGITNTAMTIDQVGNVGIGTTAPTSPLQVVGLPVYANNAAAIAGGLTAGAFYRTGGDPDPVCVVH